MQLKKAIQNIVRTPSVTFSLVGPPGVGKTMQTAAELREAGYEVRVVPCQNMLIEDTSRFPELVNGEVVYRPNTEWVPRPGKPVAIILDELSKADAHVVNAFLPLIHGLPRTFMGIEFPPGTIVVITGNPTEFNAGDVWRPHIVNRMVSLDIAPPEVEEALRVMTHLGFDALVTMWVESTPAALITYDPIHAKKKRSERGAYFGWSENDPLAPFCSMRTLHMLSDIIKATGETPASEVIAGCIGAAAASSFVQFCEGTGVRVPHAEIIQSPETAHVPAKKLDKRLVAIQCANAYTDSTHDALFTYAKRLGDDLYQAVFGAYLFRVAVDATNPKTKFRLGQALSKMFNA
jgi:hypothetical protein